MLYISYSNDDIIPKLLPYQFFPSEGINVFGNGFHTHVAGKDDYIVVSVLC